MTGKKTFEIERACYLMVRLGGRRIAGFVLGLWVIVGVFTLPYIAQLQEATTNDATAFLPANAESTKLATAQKVFPDNADLELTIVYRRNDGRLTVADRDRIESDRTELVRKYDQTNAEVPIVPSEDARAAYISLNVPNVKDDDAQVAEVEAVRALVGADERNFDVKVTGPGAFVADAEAVYSGIDIKLLGLTMTVVAVLLLVTYRSPILWILPIAAVALGNGLASWLLYLLADRGLLTIDGQTAGILPVLVFGAGTDYALLLISRYRDELRSNEPVAAMKVALRRAGPTMLISGFIVGAALLCLLISDLNSNKSLGPVGALSLLLTLLATLTALPAMLVLGGRWIFWPYAPKLGTKSKPPRVWGRIGEWVLSYPKTIASTTAVVLAIGCFGLLAFDGTLRPIDSFRGEPDSVKGQELVRLSFPEGATEPLFLVTNTRQAIDIRTALSSVDGLGPIAETNRTAPGPSAECVPDNNDANVCVDLNGKTEYAIVMTSPSGSEAETGTIDAVRAAVRSVSEAGALVGGSSAEALDLQRAAARDRLVVIPVVLLLVFALFCLFLRAVAAPALLVATVILSFGFSLGVSVLTFRYLFGFPAEDSGLILLGFVFLVALGVDYNVFLAARIREEAQKVDTRTATLVGLTATGGVITSAGAVLAATFAVLATLPIVSITQIGVLVAFGVLIDTFVVRSLLVPAVMAILGERAWWPSSRLDFGRPAGKRFRA